MTDTLTDLLREHTRLSQDLLGHTTVQVVPDIASRAMKLDRNEAKIVAAFIASRPDADTVSVPRAEIEAVLAGCIWDEDARPVLTRWLGEESR